MVLTIASSLRLFDRALRSHFDFHLLAYAAQESTRIFHSPLDIRHRKPRSCGHGADFHRLQAGNKYPFADLHLDWELQGMIRSVNVEGAFRGQVLRAFSSFERPFDF